MAAPTIMLEIKTGVNQFGWLQHSYVQFFSEESYNKVKNLVTYVARSRERITFLGTWVHWLQKLAHQA